MILYSLVIYVMLLDLPKSSGAYILVISGIIDTFTVYVQFLRDKVFFLSMCVAACKTVLDYNI